MTFDEVRKRRRYLENEIGAMLRNFEKETTARIGGISFGPIYVQAVGEVERPKIIQHSETYECSIQACL